MIPVVNVRYICFYFVFLYSLIPWVWPKCGPEEDQKLMRGKNSIVRHLKWNLVTTQSHHPSITPLSSWTPKTNRNTMSFSSSSVGWSVQEEILSAKKSSVCSSQSSPSPHSQCLSKYGLAGLGPKLKGRHHPPSSHTRPFPFSPLHHQKNMHTHLFTVCWYFNHQHLSSVVGAEGTFIVCLIPLQTTILPLLFLELQQMAQHLGLQGGTGAYLENCQERCWKNPPGFLRPPLAHFPSSFYSAGGSRRPVWSTSDSYFCSDSALGLILPSSWVFVSGKKTKSSRKTLVKEDGKENFERTGVRWGGVLCQARAGWVPGGGWRGRTWVG